MPFLAACSICGRKSHVPDNARGGLMRCPGCSSFYALPARSGPFRTSCTHCGRESCVPARALGGNTRCPVCCHVYTVVKKSSDVSIPALSGGAVSPGAWWESPTEPPDQPPAGEPAPNVEDTAVKAPTLPSEPALPAEPERPVVERVEPLALDPLGIGALCLGCTALLCASISWLCVLLVPLSLIGLLAGVTSLMRVVRWRQVRPAIPVAGTVVCAAVLLLGAAFPALLGPTYRTYKTVQMHSQPANKPTAAGHQDCRHEHSFT
jgi:hypothetical protein